VDCSKLVTRPLSHTSDGRPAVPPGQPQEGRGLQRIARSTVASFSSCGSTRTSRSPRRRTRMPWGRPRHP
jgi:hypothetical protein